MDRLCSISAPVLKLELGMQINLWNYIGGQYDSLCVCSLNLEFVTMSYF